MVDDLNIKVNKINYGIACRIGDNIYLNRKLENYPLLYDTILSHEFSHSSGFNKNDLLIDLNNKHLKGYKKEYYSFILTHPSSWTEFLPFGVYKNKFVISPLILGIWILGLILFLIWKLIL
jgi:hypothetical protein